MTDQLAIAPATDAEIADLERQGITLNLIARLRQEQVRAAAMREALENASEMLHAIHSATVYAGFNPPLYSPNGKLLEWGTFPDNIFGRIRAALAPDAGRELLDRLAKAEAELALASKAFGDRGILEVDCSLPMPERIDNMIQELKEWRYEFGVEAVKVEKLQARVAELEDRLRWRDPVNGSPPERTLVMIALPMGLDFAIFLGGRVLASGGMEFLSKRVAGWLPLPEPPKAKDGTP